MTSPTHQSLNMLDGQKETNDHLLNQLEKISIRTLASYMAYEHGINENLMLAIVTGHFGADNIDQFKSKDYDPAIRYLLNFKIKETLN